MDDSKTNAEVMSLIDSWEANPSWELEDTPGFEDHYTQLRAYRIKKEKHWEEARVQKKIKAAESMGMTLPIYNEWCEFKTLGESQRAKAASMLTQLVYDTTKVSIEQQTTINLLIDGILRSAINYAKAELLKDSLTYSGKRL